MEVYDSPIYEPITQRLCTLNLLCKFGIVYNNEENQRVQQDPKWTNKKYQSHNIDFLSLLLTFRS